MSTRLSFPTHLLRSVILVLLPPVYVIITGLFPSGIRDSYRRWIMDHPAIVVFAGLWWLGAMILDIIGDQPDRMIAMDVVSLTMVAVLAALYPAYRADEKPGPDQGAP